MKKNINDFSCYPVPVIVYIQLNNGFEQRFVISWHRRVATDNIIIFRNDYCIISDNRVINIACPPSALLCAKEKDKPSEFAMQGIDAHTLCEHKLKLALGQQSKDPTEDLTFFDEEMADCTDMYAQYVME